MQALGSSGMLQEALLGVLFLSVALQYELLVQLLGEEWERGKDGVTFSLDNLNDDILDDCNETD